MRSRVSWSLVAAAAICGVWVSSYAPRVHTLELPWPAVSVYVQDGYAVAERLGSGLRSAAWLPMPDECRPAPSVSHVRIRSQHSPIPVPRRDNGWGWIHLGFASGMLTGLWALWAVVLLLRTRRRVRRTRCTHCAYDLQGQPAPVSCCSECGTAVTPAGGYWKLRVAQAIWPATALGCVVVFAMVWAMWHSIFLLVPTRSLHEAAAFGRLGDMARFLDEGADLNAADVCGSTALHYAALGQPEAVRLLVARGADLEARRNRTEWTPLRLAILYGGDEAALALLEAGADVNVQDSMRVSVFTEAILRKNEVMVRAMLRYGPDLNPGPEVMFAPLVQAAFNGTSLDIIRQMLEMGADPGQVGTTGGPALVMALLRASPQDLVRLLVEYGADVNQVSPFGGTALGYSFQHGGDMVEFLLDHGADPNGGAATGNLALHGAIDNRSVIAVRLLLERGASTQLTDQNGRDVTHRAAQAALPEVLRLVLEFDPVVTRRDAEGATPLHLAASAEVARVLLDAGAEVNAQDAAGWTPLRAAVEHDAVVLARTLLAAGADPGIADELGVRPLDRARERGLVEIRQLLEARAVGGQPCVGERGETTVSQSGREAGSTP